MRQEGAKLACGENAITTPHRRGRSHRAQVRGAKPRALPHLMDGGENARKTGRIAGTWGRYGTERDGTVQT